MLDSPCLKEFRIESLRCAQVEATDHEGFGRAGGVGKDEASVCLKKKKNDSSPLLIRAKIIGLGYPRATGAEAGFGVTCAWTGWHVMRKMRDL